MWKWIAVLMVMAGTATGVLSLQREKSQDDQDADAELSSPSQASPDTTTKTDTPTSTPDNPNSVAAPSSSAATVRPATASAGLAEASPFNAYAHFQMGNYEGAVSQLRAIIKQRPGDELVRKNLSVALLALGFFKLQKKELAEADAAFEESARLGNDDARKALAALKLRQGQVETARSLFEDLSKFGSDPESYKILIDLALSQDEIERADDLINRLNESMSRDAAGTPQALSPELTNFIENRRKRLEQKRNFLKVQDVVSKPGIDVSYSSPELRPSAESVAKAIENVQSRLVQILGPLPSHARLRAWLVPTNDFHSVTGAPPWAAAVFDGYIRIPVGRTTQGRPFSSEVLGRLAQHETTHAYMYAFCGDILPSWIGEGLAQIYEGRSVSQSHSDLMRYGRNALTTFEPELELPFSQAPSNKITRLYARAHLLVNAMSREGGSVGQTWQRVLSSVCVQRRPLPDVLQEQFAFGTVGELWGKYFGEAAENP